MNASSSSTTTTSSFSVVGSLPSRGFTSSSQDSATQRQSCPNLRGVQALRRTKTKEGMERGRLSAAFSSTEMSLSILKS